MERDYSKRTSHLYDDRDADTVYTLETPLIKVCHGKAPRMAFFLVPSNDGINKTTFNISVEGYVRMADIPDDLRLQVRKALGLAKEEAE